MLVIACAVLAIQLGGSRSEAGYNPILNAPLPPFNDLVDPHWDTPAPPVDPAWDTPASPVDPDWGDRFNLEMPPPAMPRPEMPSYYGPLPIVLQDKWQTTGSETITLEILSCEAWTYTAITHNVVKVTFRPEEFPAGCSPEKDLLITSRFFSKGDCLTGKKCENENEKLINGTDICAYSDTLMEPFTSSSDLSTKEFVMESEPICSEERKVVFAVKSFCFQPVKVHALVESRLVDSNSSETCYHDHENEALRITCTVLGFVFTAVLVIFYQQGMRRLRLERLQRRMARENISSFQMTSYAPVPGYPVERQSFAANGVPVSTQLPPSFPGADAENEADPRNKDHTPPL